MSYTKKIIVTGGAGFIGTHVVKRLVHEYPDYLIINLDALTYAGNLENLKEIEDQDNYIFEKADVTNVEEISALLDKYRPDGIIHLAAESHVDRSISNPLSFVETNVLGTVILLNLSRELQDKNPDFRFYQVSTDEVYGSLGKEGLFTESTPYDPRSPYSASKASADHFVRAYAHTFGLNVVISNCSNNYGPYQFPEKLIPLMINNILHSKELPVYGDGMNVRDWLWVEDHAEAIDLVFHKGIRGNTYNIGGNEESTNLDLVHLLCDQMDKALGRKIGRSRELIKFVKDRPGHDRRYAIDASKIKKDLGWEPSIDLQGGLRKTIDWYLNHQEWLKHVTSGEYMKYYEKQYG
ncbi:MAG: dTDP-glucose 4,6-dehydratase [Saprospiraceae bacterium]|nr:dTDP-glucose 4,6-dehydratase [Saprospiraceae bacterium]